MFIGRKNPVLYSRGKQPHGDSGAAGVLQEERGGQTQEQRRYTGQGQLHDLIARQCTMWASVVTGCTLDVCGQYGVHVTYY